MGSCFLLTGPVSQEAVESALGQRCVLPYGYAVWRRTVAETIIFQGLIGQREVLTPICRRSTYAIPKKGVTLW
jgi:hypothetical protein